MYVCIYLYIYMDRLAKVKIVNMSMGKSHCMAIDSNGKVLT
jgi:hypothetical protein